MPFSDSSAGLTAPVRSTTGNVPSAHAASSTELGSHPTANVWACLSGPINRVEAAHALLGIDKRSLRQLGASQLLTTPVAGHLLDNAPRILNEPGFPHNQVELAVEMTAGLRSLNAVGGALESIPTWAYDDEALRQARGAYARSTALAQHSALHEPAVHTQATATPSRLFTDAALGLSTLLELVDTRTELQHHIFLTVLSIAAATGIDPRVTIRDAMAQCGPIAFRHARTRGNEAASGIRVGSILLDVANYRGEPAATALERLSGRARGLRPVLIADVGEVAAHEAAIRAELETARG